MLDSGAVQVTTRYCDLDAIADRLVTEFQPRAQAGHLALRKAGRFLKAETDPVLLESALRNLIDNAVKFTEHGGILIAGRTGQGAPVIEIWDTGPGIPTAMEARIFEAFQRLDGSAARSGLGLALVRRLCVLIGAGVSVCSRQGHGSRFALTLPPPGRESLGREHLRTARSSPLFREVCRF